MDPPAKRLRILRSVEVDEEDPDYVFARQQQQQKFKCKLESLFAKYGNMHESMSDEIDMRANKIVVDRGHLRRLERQVERKETALLDTLGLTVRHDSESGTDQEEDSEDSEDELALVSRPKGKKRGSAEMENSNQAVASQLETGTKVAVQSHTQIADTPDPGANLLQLVQFPPTPAGQQAQTTFYTNLTNTINQAVQQAMVPLLSSLNPASLGMQPSFNTPQVAPLAAHDHDRIAPASDPKWFFPPIQTTRDRLRGTHSSPITQVAQQRAKKSMSTTVRSKIIMSALEKNVESKDKSDIKTLRLSSEALASQDRIPSYGNHNASPHVILPKTSKKKCPPVLYPFTETDGMLIIRKRPKQRVGWPDVQKSKDEWKDWPLSTFKGRWQRDIKFEYQHRIASPENLPDDHNTQESHLPTPTSVEDEQDNGEEDDYESRDKDATTHSLLLHSYLDDDERELLSRAGTCSEVEQAGAMEYSTGLLQTSEDVYHAISRSAQFDNDDEELLADTDSDSEHEMGELRVDSTPCMSQFISETVDSSTLPDDDGREPPSIADAKMHVIQANNNPASSPSSYEDMILPSIETEQDGDDYEAIKEQLAREASVLEGTPIKTEPPVSSPSNHSTQLRTPKLNYYFLCTMCQKSFSTRGSLQRHHKTNCGIKERQVLEPSSSINLVGGEDEADDEIQYNVTPYIKRERTTPPLHTLMTINTPSSAIKFTKSASQADRSAVRKQSMRNWTKKGVRPARSMSSMRRSFQISLRENALSDSEDELY